MGALDCTGEETVDDLVGAKGAVANTEPDGLGSRL